MRNTAFGLWAAAGALLGLPMAVAADEPSIEARLEHLAEVLEEQREAMHIPGMAIAVVKDDQIIMARGLGHRNVEANLPADEHTLFAIGSSTKAFTAALVGMLVDEGKMQWDDPIRNHLPEFQLHDEQVAAKVTLRDTLSHRTGLNRTDVLWVSGKASRAEILQAIADAELYSPYQEKWHYNNIMYLAAGEASARAAGTDWESLLTERLFKPLGMDASNVTYEEAQADPMLSKGYRWNEQREAYDVLPMRKLGPIAPAGAINSTVTDMAQWVRLQLNRGEIDGTRLVSEAQIEETWKPMIDVSPAMEYGMGWFVREWEGRRLVEHGGNIDGFAATVSLLPDENIGFVLLTNVSHSPLQSMAHGLVYGALLNDLDSQAPQQSMELDEYVGKYHFAPMEADFTVLIKDGALAVDVPDQMVYELKPPDEQGKWYFELTDTIAVSFDRNEADEIVQMKLHQAGMTFDLPREGVTLPLEVDMEQVGPYLGTYHDPEMDVDVTVLIQNGRLAVDVPGQMVFELKQPDDEGRWYTRLTDEVFLTFDADEQGEVTLTRHQGGEAVTMQRIEVEESAPEVLSVDELLALVARGHNTAAAKDIKTIRIVEDIRMVHQGVTGTSTTTGGEDGRVRQEVDLGKFGYIRKGVAGDTGWVDSDIQQDDADIPDEAREELRMSHPLVLYTDWRESFDEVEVRPGDVLDDRSVHVVRLIAGSVQRTLKIDAETGLILAEITSSVTPGIGRLTQEVRYEAHQDVQGLKLPGKSVLKSDLMGRMVSTVKEVAVNIELPEGHFTAP